MSQQTLELSRVSEHLADVANVLGGQTLQSSIFVYQRNELGLNRFGRGFGLRARHERRRPKLSELVERIKDGLNRPELFSDILGALFRIGQPHPAARHLN